MAGSFRDSFTKEDTKEDLLGYDDTAFHYFAITLLSCVAVPWTLSMIYSLLFPGHAQIEKDFPARSSSGLEMRHPRTTSMVERVENARREARDCNARVGLSWAARLTVLAAIWVGIFGTVMRLGDEKDIKKFDPFDILDVTPVASNIEIKRAYRKLSLIYHPDKNPDDPLAQSRFIQITKAYQALTDDTARRNYEKFGNPDGPQTSKVGIGLPRFLLEKDNHLLILLGFFFILLFVVPMTFICYYQQTKNYAANGVMIETLQFLGYYINENTRAKSCPELLAACAESRNMKTRPTDNAALKAFGTRVQEHKKRAFTLPVVMKNQFLVWAHMQRQHEAMSPELRADCDELLGYSMRITQAMIEIACMREWFSSTQAIIEFRRCLLQALDVKSNQLIQVPHVTDVLAEKCVAAKPAVSTLAEFVSLSAEKRKSLLDTLSDQQCLDVEAFCAHVGSVKVRADIEVEDEKEFVVGDVATVTVQMERTNLHDSEAMGAVHAPFFPDVKFEEWWFFLVEAPAKPADGEKPAQARIVHFERITDIVRCVEQKLRFQITVPEACTLVLHALCDSYAGIDQQVELTFSAKAEEDCKREFKVHPDDEDLDMQPTLFQQFVGELGAEEESEEEEEGIEDDGGGKPAERSSAKGAAVAREAVAAQDAHGDDESGSGSSSDTE